MGGARDGAELGMWLAFLSELLVMLVIVSDRRKYLMSHPLDLAIVVLTPPFLVSAVPASGCCACFGSSGSCD